MAFETLKKLLEGEHEYLEVPVEYGLLDLL